jgi:RNA polymerase sigma factor (sigma-70 family)
MEQESLTELFRTMDEILDDREKAVLRSRYGIGCEEMTLREIASMLSLTRERVRQIEIQAMDKLKSVCKV